MLELDVVAEPDAPEPPAPTCLGPARLEAGPVGQRHDAVLRGRVVAAVVEQAQRIAVRHRRGRYEIAPAQRHAIEAVSPGREVDRALDDEHHLGPAGGPIRRGRRSVAQHRPAVHRHCRHVIHAGRDADPLGERDERDGVRADVAGILAAEGQERSPGVEGQLDGRDEVTTLIVRQKRLQARARPLDRTSDATGGPGHQRVLGVRAVTRPVAAAHVVRHHAHRALGYAEHTGDLGAQSPGTARPRVDGVAAVRLVPVARRRARLHWHAGDAIDACLEAHDVRGPGDCRLDGRVVAGERIDAEIALGLVPDDRRARGDSVQRADDGGQRLVVHDHVIDAIAGEGGRLGDHHDHRLADAPHAIRGQWRVRCDEECRAVTAPQRNLVWIGWYRAVRNPRKLRGGRAGEHGEDARQRCGRADVDAPDPRVRVRRAEERRVDLARQRNVVAVAAATGDQAPVFRTANGLADALPRCVGARIEE